MNQRQAVKTIEALREDVALSAAGDAIHIDIPPRGRHSRRRKKQRAAAAAVTVGTLEDGYVRKVPLPRVSP